MGVSLVTRSCLRRSEVSSGRRRLTLPSPMSTIPGGPTTRVTTSCCLVTAIAGSVFHPRRSIPSAAAAAPGLPSIWLSAAFWARRPNTISTPSVPNSTPKAMANHSDLSSSRMTAKPARPASRNTPSRIRPIRVSDCLVIV